MRIRNILRPALVLVISLAVLCWLLARQSLPNYPAELTLSGLQAPVHISLGRHGVPSVNAANRHDVYFALGYLIANERLFQMDLARRSGAGRLAELFGHKALESDRWHRLMGFRQVAEGVVARLASEEIEVLSAYRDGVNQAMTQVRQLPWEFKALGYRPEPWQLADTVLAVLRMYEMLSNTIDDERMVTVLDAALPKDVVAFLTPRYDRYTADLLGLRPRNGAELPLAALKQLLQDQPSSVPLSALTTMSPSEFGSNAWVVGPPKTQAGEAIVANDPHLRLSLPNIWFRIELSYPGVHVVGATLPGVPAVVSGSNGRVAWGYTNVQGDFLDLVKLDIDSKRPDDYLTKDGSEALAKREEKIRIRDAPDETYVVRTSRWGPVLDTPLLGHPVAVHWLALDPNATDFGMLKLERVANVPEAMDVFNQLGGPPQNVMLADSLGNIGWTLMGRIPDRVGFDGSIAQAWADGTRHWRGYLDPKYLPRVMNPPEGFLVTANQRTVPLDHPYILGHNFSSGYRAFRIAQRLRRSQAISVDDMLRLQLDTRTEFYRYYQRLALRVIDTTADPTLESLKAYLAAWDGHANADSLALPVLIEFRAKLTDAILSPLLQRCKALEPSFVYQWRMADKPLRAIIDADRPELLPQPERYKTWSAFLLNVLRESVQAAMQKANKTDLADLKWGQTNRVQIAHPLSQVSKLLSTILDMPSVPLPGCGQCVRVATEKNGASERLVVAPGKESSGIYQMPGGQSGNFFSAHYADQQSDWLEGRHVPLIDEPSTEFTMLPASPHGQ